MSTLIEAARQALEALEDACGGRCNAEYNPCFQREAIISLRQAIEQAHKRPQNCGTGYCSCIECVMEPEPTAWLVEFENGEQELHFEKQAVGETITPLYSHPPPRQPEQAEPVSIEIKKAIAVAIAGLAENHMQDVLEVFSTDQLVEILEFTRAYQSERVEEIYKQALDQLTTQQPRQPEPVIDRSAAIRIATALGWTPPRQWVGLTDEEVKHQWEVWRANAPRYIGFAKGIEEKLKQKNGYAEENT